MSFVLFEHLIDHLRNFLEAGGVVLVAILLTTLALWTLIIERFMFFRFISPKIFDKTLHDWIQREDRSSWKAHKIREARLSEVGQMMNRSIPLIKTLVAVCPLLGLLGTVTGMIAVFDSLALTGTSNARLMASGISMATIPTMAGMVASLSGLYFGSRFEAKAKLEKEKLSDTLSFSAM